MPICIQAKRRKKKKKNNNNNNIMRHSRCVSEALMPERVRWPRLQAVPGKFLGTRSLVDITPSNCKRNGPEITIHPIEIDSRLPDCLFDIT